jgi:hypothetical protein
MPPNLDAYWAIANRPYMSAVPANTTSRRYVGRQRGRLFFARPRWHADSNYGDWCVAE